ncbi:zinc-dependent alcohol dehydrogenase [Actinoplanes awajinensis]|uniref:Alcohol dehydrogenase n=1 Tax=Actinoplanes awajinensis subsp. mycoplanecinus TaxID=135947 RepID=A0A0X3V8K2_9ACTN|nr:alcohol dehydrogenase catalytic domain-containing protein [Actinoplanes awajinensis]KUL41105.1 alcohol dehydrogenase [Actinoplanes awajinensis subsp. mycoplanecinus]
MRALVFTAPGRAEVQDVPEPQAGPGHVIVQVERVGVCGTDVELFTGAMSYLHTGAASYPLRPGHEWAGTVVAAGAGVDHDWVGRRVTGDTMIGCGHCVRCRSGRHHVCARRHELGCRDGLPGALTERLEFPAAYLHELPDTVDATLGALVEPGGNALRAVRAAAVGPGERLLILGTGTIGLLAAMFGRAQGAEVHLLGLRAEPLAQGQVWTRETLPELAWDGVIDATNAAVMPGLAVELVEPGRTVVYIGLSGAPSVIDTRDVVFKDVTTVGILGASAGLAGAITSYGKGEADPRPLVAATVSLEQIVGVLAGKRPDGAGPGPKFHVDPRL